MLCFRAQVYNNGYNVSECHHSEHAALNTFKLWDVGLTIQNHLDSIKSFQLNGNSKYLGF